MVSFAFVAPVAAREPDAYQVWSMTYDGQMISAGVFTPADNGHVAAVLNGGAAGVEKFMITLEPPADRSTRPG